MKTTMALHCLTTYLLQTNKKKDTFDDFVPILLMFCAHKVFARQVVPKFFKSCAP